MIGAPSDLALVVAARDVGDELSASGARALLAGIPYRELALDQLYGTRGHTALLLGRGFSRQDHEVMPRALAVAELRFQRVIVLPCALDPTDDVVHRALSRSRATVFASDPESYRQIEPLCEARLAHDCAFFLELPGDRTGGSGELAALGEDLGAADAPALLRAIAESQEVRTDRVRVMIAAALMGKPVRYLRGPDHELEALAHHFLDGYPVTEIPPEPPGPVGPAPLDEAAQRTLELLQTAAPAAPAQIAAIADELAEARISVVILTQGRAAHLHRALDSIARNDAALRTIVIDDNSAPSDAEAIRAVCAAHPDVMLRRSERSLGSTAGRNLGVTLAGGTEFVFFLDDDAELIPGALAHLLAVLDGHPEAGAVSATLIRPDGTLIYAGGKMHVTDELAIFELTGDGEPFVATARAPSGATGWVPFTALLVRRELFEKFPMDEGIERYLGDNEWCYRVSRDRRACFWYSREALVLHDLRPKHRPGADWGSRSRMIELLNSHARFYARSGLLLGPWLFDHVPELRAADGTWDVAGGRLLMELLMAKGPDWTFMAWMNGDLEGMLTGNTTRADLEAERKRLVQEGMTFRRQAALMRAQAAHDASTIATLDSALNEANGRLRRVDGSVSWQLFLRLRRRTFAVLGGEESPGVAALQRALRVTGRRFSLTGPSSQRSQTSSRLRGPSRLPEVELPTAEDPDVSIVIPLYAHAGLTAAALESIAEHTGHLPYEVILVDDAADQRTKQLLGKVRGARILVNDSNLGYLRSVERGAAAARGSWLVLCNNDIEVQPGWLAALVDCGESADDIAIVAPKFLAPDGSLSEAGAIIWRDGTGANYGRGDDPGCCHYEYRREIDYGSAAALLVRRDFWEEVGGFDDRFLPMYYEDTDLCFEARRRGLRVLYEPRAQVIHVEGATAGTDESASHKRHQESNRPKFVAKWKAVLSAEHLPDRPRDLWLAANRHRRPHVLVADHRVPTWDRDSGGLRMRGLVEALVDLGCQVTLMPDNLVAIEPYTREFQRLGVEVIYNVDVRATLGMIGPTLSLAILSRPQVASHWLQLVRETAPTALIAYDTVDLHWVREARRAALAQGNGAQPPALDPKVKAMRELELALIRATDMTLVVTEEERRQVLSDEPEAVVEVLPNVNTVRITVPPAAERAGVVFVGGFEHPPNTDGALMLVREVMPLVWNRLGPVPVTIVGADPPPEVQRLASRLVSVAGWVHDLDPVLDGARALVAPLRYGAGMKGKVTQAMAAGLPVVTTPIGAEGLSAIDGEHLLIGGDARELAERVVRVLEDGELWQRLSRAGQQIATERFSAAVVNERLGELLERAAPLRTEPVAIRSG